MVESRVDVLYEQAFARWPGVRWSREAYAAHLAGRSPAHPLDLYLAGAAGHRLEAAWAAIEDELGPRVRRVLLRRPTAGADVEDLWAKARTRLLEDDAASPPLPDGRPPARIIRYRGDASLCNYLITVAARIAFDLSRRKGLVVAPAGGDAMRDPPDPKAAGPDQRLAGKEIAQAMTQALRETYARFSSERQFLIAMVYRQGMKQKHAGALLGWSESKTSRDLKDAWEALREAALGAIDELSDLEWSPALRAELAACVSDLWKDVGDPTCWARERAAATARGAP